MLPRPVRHGLLAVGSVAAALVLLVAITSAAGVVHVHFGGGGTHTTLTAVTGCSQLEQADGTLEQVNGSSLVIKTASGQPVTVTTTATTFVSMSGALLSDITDGASVMVRGSRTGETIKAAIVTVGQPFSAVNPPGFVPVQGTVADASTAGFTLMTPSGTPIAVITSGGTLVVIPHASPGQLQAGATIFALGHAGLDGTLSARALAAVSQLRQGAHQRIGKGLLAQLDRRGARRDQRDARLPRLICQTPMMAGTAARPVPAIACTDRGAPLIPARSRVR